MTSNRFASLPSDCNLLSQNNSPNASEVILTVQVSFTDWPPPNNPTSYFRAGRPRYQQLLEGKGGVHGLLALGTEAIQYLANSSRHNAPYTPMSA